MGIYSAFIDRHLTGEQLTEERKKALASISEIRGRSLLVYAADSIKAAQAPVAIGYDDLLPVTDQLDNLDGTAKIDIVLETPGGSGEVAEQIVRILRKRFESVAFIVPGAAKSAGTIMTMSGDEILMDGGSALGPIDAQISFEGKQFSAEALLKGMDKIKEEAERDQRLNRAYIPMLQRISPGDLQHAENALEFARALVRDWLSVYKFRNWTVHRTHSPGAPVTTEERNARAEEIARALCDHSRWLSHGKSILLDDLISLGLEITDFSRDESLAEAIRKYYVLMRMTFDMTNAFKIIETPKSQIMRFINVIGTTPQADPVPPGTDGLLINANCPRCGNPITVQADFGVKRTLQPGAIRYPSNDVLKCSKCGNQLNLVQQRLQIEMQTKKRIAK